MPSYPYLCDAQHRWDVRRPVDERDAPLDCLCGLPARRDHATQIHSIDIPTVPRRFFIQHYDVFDRSPREMAQDPTIHRYDPTMPHKPPLRPVNIRQYLPKHGDPHLEGAARRLAEAAEKDAISG